MPRKKSVILQNQTKPDVRILVMPTFTKVIDWNVGFASLEFWMMV